MWLRRLELRVVRSKQPPRWGVVVTARFRTDEHGAEPIPALARDLTLSQLSAHVQHATGGTIKSLASWVQSKPASPGGPGAVHCPPWIATFWLPDWAAEPPLEALRKDLWTLYGDRSYDDGGSQRLDRF